VSRWQLGHQRQRSQRREPSVIVDPHVSYLATIVPIGYVRDVDEDEPAAMLQFPDPPLYADVSHASFSPSPVANKSHASTFSLAKK